VFSRSYDCLKPNAAAAVDVTAGFLVLMAKLASDKVDSAMIGQRIEEFLSVSGRSLGSGYYNCANL
jgi:hypothetical protein